MEIITLKDSRYTTETFSFFFQGIEHGYIFLEYYFFHMRELHFNPCTIKPLFM